MEFLKYRERLLLEKFMSAERVRELKNEIKSQLTQRRTNTKSVIDRNTIRVSELEDLAREHWDSFKRRQELKEKKKEFVRREKAVELMDKVRNQVKNQASKIVVKPIPTGPKIDPLGYLKKIRKKVNRSLEPPQLIQKQSKPNFFAKLSHAIKLKPLASERANKFMSLGNLKLRNNSSFG